MLRQSKSACSPDTSTGALSHQPLDPSAINAEDAEDSQSKHGDDKFSSGDEEDEVELLETAPQSISGPTGVFPSYCAQGGAVGLAIKSDSAMSSKNWTIKNPSTGEVMFNVKGKDMSMKVEKVFTDSKGQEVLILRRHKAFLSGNYYVEDMSGKEVLTFTKNGKEITATFVDHASQKRRELRIVAKWRKSRGSIFLDGVYLGMIAKEEGSSRLGMCPTYRVNVPEGLDLAVMAVVGVVFARLVTEWNEGAASIWTNIVN